MNPFFEEIIAVLIEVCDDIQYDYGFDTVAEEKIRDLIKKINKQKE